MPRQTQNKDTPIIAFAVFLSPIFQSFWLVVKCNRFKSNASGISQIIFPSPLISLVGRELFRSARLRVRRRNQPSPIQTHVDSISTSDVKRCRTATAAACCMLLLLRKDGADRVFVCHLSLIVVNTFNPSGGNPRVSVPSTRTN